MDRSRPFRLWLLALATLLSAGSATVCVAQSAQRPEAPDPRWDEIRHVFSWGKAQSGYFRVDLPRSDVHVTIGGDSLSPDFALDGYLGFAPVNSHEVLAAGELVLLEPEVTAVVAEARQRHVIITAIHNHLLGERPRIIFVHVMAQGSAGFVADALRSTIARSGIPLQAPTEEPARGDWSAIDDILGPHSEAHGAVAHYEFERREPLHAHGESVKSSDVLETASEVAFQELASNRVAMTGELYMLPSEVTPVVSALEEHGLHVTALHNHMLDDGPPRFWVHWYVTGDARALARGAAAALAMMNSDKRSKSEQAGSQQSAARQQ